MVSINNEKEERRKLKKLARVNSSFVWGQNYLTFCWRCFSKINVNFLKGWQQCQILDVIKEAQLDDLKVQIQHLHRCYTFIIYI